MDNKQKVFIISAIIIIVLLTFVLLWMNLTPQGREVKNMYESDLYMVDDATKYETLRRVEGTCRAMIASYTSDVHMAEVYKTSHRDWAEQAAIRANQTAAEYNEYILKNNYIWKGNIPHDIKTQLDYYELGE